MTTSTNPQTQADPEARIGASATRELVGGISDMTLHRWRRERGFPAPVKIAGRRYWRRADVLAWLHEQEQGADA